MKAKIITLILLVSFLVGAYITYEPKRNNIKNREVLTNFIPVHTQDINKNITTQGEIIAGDKNKIKAPSSALRKAEIWDIQIQELIPEGTSVEKGEFVGSLDKSTIARKIVNKESDLEEARQNLEEIKLDTSQELSQERNRLSNLQFNVEEKELVLEQSKFEPPATIKQNEIDLEKAKRSYKQAKEAYNFKVKRAERRVERAKEKIDKVEEELEFLRYLSNQFTIQSPQSGIIIYAQDQNGNKITEGSSISVWNPTIATLPDRSSLYSKTFVKEKEIGNINKGQNVAVSLIAFPEISMNGEVTEIAKLASKTNSNGEKLYEVKVSLNDIQEKVLPTMTTKNVFRLNSMENVTMVPLSSLYKANNDQYYLIKKSGEQYSWNKVSVKDIIDESAVIAEGIQPGDTIHASIPQAVINQEPPEESASSAELLQ